MDAVEYFNDALNADPKNEWYWIMAIQLYRDFGKPEKAAILLNQFANSDSADQHSIIIKKLRESLALR